MKALRDVAEWAAFFASAAIEGWRERRRARAWAGRQLERLTEQQRRDTEGGVF